jgi:small nuclear ribonucleoprotein (snRNP)-like protein
MVTSWANVVLKNPPNRRSSLARDRPGSSGGGSLTRDQRGPERVGNKDQQQQRLVSSPSSMSEEGAYSNQRLTYICTSLIGSNISVETEEGDIHEGVFRCFSPNLDITLDQVHTVDPDDSTRIGKIPIVLFTEMALLSISKLFGNKELNLKMLHITNLVM